MNSRNTLSGFVKRTRINLEFINHDFYEHGENSDVHVVAQVLTSLLGLVVLPAEGYPNKQNQPTADAKKEAENQTIRDHILTKMKNTTLTNHPWNKWTIKLHNPNKPTDNLKRLIKHLRNAVAHGRFTFLAKSDAQSADSRCLSDVKLQVEDAAKDKTTNKWVPNWQAEINGEDLYDFCLRLAEYIDKEAERHTA